MDRLNNNPLSYTRSYNPNFVTNEYVTYNNYPIQTVPQSIPNYAPIYNYYNDYIEYINTPQIGETIGSSQTQVPTDIPILSNLEKDSLLVFLGTFIIFFKVLRLHLKHLILVMNWKFLF